MCIELFSDLFHAVLALICGQAKCQCYVTTVTVVVSYRLRCNKYVVNTHKLQAEFQGNLLFPSILGVVSFMLHFPPFLLQVLRNGDHPLADIVLHSKILWITNTTSAYHFTGKCHFRIFYVNCIIICSFEFISFLFIASATVHNIYPYIFYCQIYFFIIQHCNCSWWKSNLPKYEKHIYRVSNEFVDDAVLCA